MNGDRQWDEVRFWQAKILIDPDSKASCNVAA